MKIEVNIKEKHAALIILFIIAASAIGLVLAYGGSQPQVLGHSWGEMACDNTLCVNSINGNVGIGTTDPGTRKLKVSGDIEATGKYYGDGSGLTGVITTSACSLCLSCGGTWPNFGGIISSSDGYDYNYGRGAGCAGDFYWYGYNVAAYLCCK